MRSPALPELRLRFPIEEVVQWAARYPGADDTSIIRIGKKARKRGRFTRAEFLDVAAWKSDRTKSRCALNSKAAVRDATTLALHTSDERLRIGALTLLRGIDMRTASVFLHLGHRDPYPILDIRALWSLGVEKEPTYYPFELWDAYVQTCRALAEEAGEGMRTVDRALWQYAAEHERP